MHLASRKVRTILSRTMRQLNAIYAAPFKKRFWLKDVRDLTALMEAGLRTSKRSNRGHFATQFDLATCSVGAIGLLALSVHRKPFNNELLPDDWLSESKRPNPNRVLQALLLQLANFSFSTVLLLQSGLDNAARALLRSVMELANQTIVLTANREDIQQGLVHALRERSFESQVK